MKGQFDLNDLRTQLRQMQSMGGLGMLAGHDARHEEGQGRRWQQSGMDDKVLVHMDAIIGSMTPKERARPELLNAKRKIRVAKGSGTQVQDVNKLLKMHQEMGTAMKQIQQDGRPQGAGRDCSARAAWARRCGAWARRRESAGRAACPAWADRAPAGCRQICRIY